MENGQLQHLVYSLKNSTPGDKFMMSEGLGEVLFTRDLGCKERIMQFSKDVVASWAFNSGFENSGNGFFRGSVNPFHKGSVSNALKNVG